MTLKPGTTTMEDVRDTRKIIAKIKAVAAECDRDLRFVRVGEALTEIVNTLDAEAYDAERELSNRKRGT